MTSYTYDQINRARQIADARHDHSRDIFGGDSPSLWAETFAKHLGITAEPEPEKPEPGTWHKVKNGGWPAFMDDDGNMLIFEFDGEITTVLDTYSWSKLTPAQVISTEELENLKRERDTWRDEALRLEVELGGTK